MAASPLLDRSPSLSSASSGSGTSSVVSVPTPAMPPVSSFPSAVYPSTGDDHKAAAMSDASNLAHQSPRTITDTESVNSTGKRSPWSAGHRAALSFDSARAKFGGDLARSPSLRTDLLSKDAPKDAERIAAWRSSHSPSSRSPRSPAPLRTGSPERQAYTGQAPSSPIRQASPAIRTPTTPTRGISHSGSPLAPSAQSFNAGAPPSPTRHGLSQSSVRASHSPSARELSSSIFSIRDGPISPHLVNDEADASVTSLKRFDSVSSAAGRGHRRALTLPHNALSNDGLPSPIAEEVAGLPGRARLSRPAEAPLSFAPSAVFSSSHGLSRHVNGPPSPSKLLLPSQTVKAIDQQRQNLVAYEYLCHVRETQEWLNSCITTRAVDASPMWGESVNDFEQSLRNGYALAHLARSLGGPSCQGPIYNDPVRHFRHTDNINIFLTFIEEVGLPRIFHFETVDLYDGKNLPKVIYCLHALSHLLYRRGMAQQMNDLVGQVEFTDAEMQATEKGLDGVRMPNFRGIGKALDKHDKTIPEETPEQKRQRQLLAAEPGIIGFQACARGAIARWQFETRRREQAAVERRRREAEKEGQKRQEELRLQQEEYEAAARAQAQRDHDEAIRRAAQTMVGLQAHARGALARTNLLRRIRLLRSNEDFVVRLQTAARTKLARRQHQAKANHLRRAEVVRSFGGLQSAVRAALVRKQVDVQKQKLGFVEPDVVGVQAHIRGYLGRRAFLEWRDNLYRNEGVVEHLQSLWRGTLARRQYDRLRWQLHNSSNVIVRLQALARSRRQEAQYRQLRMGTNVPVSTIRNFARLLDDSEFDFRGEMLVETLRKQLVATIRETQDLEDDVRDLDTKIALLVKNKITHEVARAQRSRAGGLAPLKRDTLLAAANDPFASETLDRQTQRKLELYQQMFYHLQTEPSYFARLFASVERSDRKAKLQKVLETITLVIFGYAQAQREEYLLLKLFQRSMEEELRFVPDIASFVRGNFTFIRVLMQYGRGVSQRKFLLSVLGHHINDIMERPGLDLGTDPVVIYRTLIANEETRTGLPTKRPTDVDYTYAVSDAETNQVFSQHLIALRQATDAVLRSLLASTDDLPYGVRYVARELFRALMARFPGEPEAEMMRVAGHLVYYRFIQPAIIAPETFDIIQGVIPVQQRQNLSEVAKLLNQIAVGRLFGEDQLYLMPMNKFVEASAMRFASWMREVISVEDAEVHFRADEWIDAKSSRQPVVYISPNDIYATHSALAENLDAVAPEHDDALRGILIELGGVPTSATAELDRARADEVPLTLTTRLRAEDDPQAEKKVLFSQAKRRVLGILKVHSGADLEQVLAQVVTAEDEAAWAQIVEEELEDEARQARAQRRHLIPQPDDIRRMTFHQLKMTALQDILKLRQAGMISKANKYQGLLDSIAHDIRSKHHRRVQRQSEISNMEGTLSALRSKKTYLEDQIKSYHVYIDQSMASIQKKSKRRINLPWSLQASHERQLDRAGKRYKYGSYKYTAQTLYDRGVLLSIDQYSPKQFDKVNLTFSSDEVGVFEISAEFGGKAVTTVVVKLEDLLEAQFVGRQTLEIGDVAKVNLNLLVHLINRKFYT